MHKTKMRSAHRSFISYKKRRKYKRTPAADTAAQLVRELLEFLRPLTTLVSVANCYPYKFGYPMPNGAYEAYMAGDIYLRACGNRNSCPVCSRAFMAVKRSEVEVALANWEQAGGTMFMQTLTQSHSSSDPTSAKYERISEAWTAMRKRSRFKRIAADVAGPHVLKVQEEVLTEKGWFPHLHVIWLFQSDVDPADAEAFLAEVQDLWIDSSIRVNPSGADASGQDFRQIELGSTLNVSRYIFKNGFLTVMEKQITDFWCSELTPLELLRYIFHTGDADALTLWIDYENASIGNQRIRTDNNFPWP